MVEVEVDIDDLFGVLLSRVAAHGGEVAGGVLELLGVDFGVIGVDGEPFVVPGVDFPELQLESHSVVDWQLCEGSGDHCSFAEVAVASEDADIGARRHGSFTVLDIPVGDVEFRSVEGGQRGGEQVPVIAHFRRGSGTPVTDLAIIGARLDVQGEVPDTPRLVVRILVQRRSDRDNHRRCVVLDR